jgi:E1-E2 ATPase
MKTTSKTIDSAGQVGDDSHEHDPHSHGQHHDHDDHNHDDHDHGTGTAEYVRLGLMGIIVVASLTGWWRPFMDRDWLAFAGTVIGGFPIYKEAWENLLKRRMTMELSMTIALLSALAIGQFFTAIVIAFFVLFAELLEGYTVGGGRRAIEKLITALPRHVTVRRNGQERELKAEELSAGEVIVIRPGERIPVDGTVTKGSSYVDQSSITGESLPIEKTEQSKVFAGTINKNGVLGGQRRASWAGYDLWENHPDRETGRKIQGASAANRGSTCSRSGILRPCCRYSNLSRHAQSYLDNRRDHCCWSLRSCGRHAVGNSSGYRERGPTRDYRKGWTVSREARGYRYHRLRQDWYTDDGYT